MMVNVANGLVCKAVKIKNVLCVVQWNLRGKKI